MSSSTDTISDILKRHPEGAALRHCPEELGEITFWENEIPAPDVDAQGIDTDL